MLGSVTAIGQMPYKFGIQVKLSARCKYKSESMAQARKNEFCRSSVSFFIGANMVKCLLKVGDEVLDFF